jgi:hypothetical protein
MLAALVLVGATLWGHQPVVESGRNAQLAKGTLQLEASTDVGDPGRASVAVYGNLHNPEELDLYRFQAVQDSEIPAEVLVPVRPSNERFRPWLVLIGEEFPQGPEVALPFRLPSGWHALIIEPPVQERSIFHEPYSQELLWHGQEQQVKLTSGRTYYAAVFDPAHYVGSYSLALGIQEDFTNVSKLHLVGNVLRAKLGPTAAAGDLRMDMIGASIFLAGVLCALASRRGRLAAFAGLVLAVIGSLLLYRELALSGVALFQALLGAGLLLSLFWDGVKARTWRTIAWSAESGLLMWYLIAVR